MFLFNSSTNATKTLLDSPTRLADGKARRDVVAGNAVEGVEERKCRRFCEGLKSKHVLPSPSPQSVQRAWLQSTIAALPSPEVPVAEPLRSTDDLPPPQSASPPPPPVAPDAPPSSAITCSEPEFRCKMPSLN